MFTSTGGATLRMPKRAVGSGVRGRRRFRMSSHRVKWANDLSCASGIHKVLLLVMRILQWYNAAILAMNDATITRSTNCAFIPDQPDGQHGTLDAPYRYILSV